MNYKLMKYESVPEPIQRLVESDPSSPTTAAWLMTVFGLRPETGATSEAIKAMFGTDIGKPLSPAPMTVPVPMAPTPTGHDAEDDEDEGLDDEEDPDDLLTVEFVRDQNATGHTYWDRTDHVRCRLDVPRCVIDKGDEAVREYIQENMGDADERSTEDGEEDSSESEVDNRTWMDITDWEVL